MISEEKENRCFIKFYCIDSNIQPCLYKRGEEKCEYNINNMCTSVVARSNEMINQLKEYLN